MAQKLKITTQKIYAKNLQKSEGSNTLPKMKSGKRKSRHKIRPHTTKETSRSSALTEPAIPKQCQLQQAHRHTRRIKRYTFK